jgi:hypothetical protein
MYQRAGGKPLAVAAATSTLSILELVPCGRGGLSPRGRPCSSCCWCLAAAFVKPSLTQPNSGARRLRGARRGTPSATSLRLDWSRSRSAAQGTQAWSISRSPWMACRWKCPRMWELIGFARSRLRCIPTTALARYGSRAVEPTRSRSDTSSRSGVCGSMIAALDRHAEISGSLSTASSAPPQPRCVWPGAGSSRSRHRHSLRADVRGLISPRLFALVWHSSAM